MIKEAYCSFEVEKLLKEKGFTEECEYFLPTHQRAIAWLRTKHIIIVVQPEYFNADGTCSYWGVDIWADDNYEKLQGDFPSYEQAVEVAIKYSLENLI